MCGDDVIVSEKEFLEVQNKTFSQTGKDLLKKWMN